MAATSKPPVNLKVSDVACHTPGSQTCKTSMGPHMQLDTGVTSIHSSHITTRRRIRTVLTVTPTHYPTSGHSVQRRSSHSRRCLTNGSLRKQQQRCNSAMSKAYNSSINCSSFMDTDYDNDLKAVDLGFIDSPKKTLNFDCDLEDDDASSSSSSSSGKTGSSGASRDSGYQPSGSSCDGSIRQSQEVLNSVSTGNVLGERPPCVGQESSPMLHRFLKDVETSQKKRRRTMYSQSLVPQQPRSCMKPKHHCCKLSLSGIDPSSYMIDTSRLSEENNTTIASSVVTDITEPPRDNKKRRCTTCHRQVRPELLRKRVSFGTTQFRQCSSSSLSTASQVSAPEPMQQDIEEKDNESDCVYVPKSTVSPLNGVRKISRRKSFSKKLKKFGKYLQKLGSKSSVDMSS